MKTMKNQPKADVQSKRLFDKANEIINVEINVVINVIINVEMIQLK